MNEPQYPYPEEVISHHQLQAWSKPSYNTPEGAEYTINISRREAYQIAQEIGFYRLTRNDPPPADFFNFREIISISAKFLLIMVVILCAIGGVLLFMKFLWSVLTKF